jgi:hypothetical protein
MTKMRRRPEGYASLVPAIASNSADLHRGQIREGFIVDEDEEEDADDVEDRERRKKKKRRRVEREEEEQLDEEDLDLIGEAHPEWERKSQPQVRLVASAYTIPTRAYRSC